jgi:hypothetical protein
MNDPPLVAATWKKWHLTDFECSRVRITLDTTRFMGVFLRSHLRCPLTILSGDVVSDSSQTLGTRRGV